MLCVVLLKGGGVRVYGDGDGDGFDG